MGIGRVLYCLAPMFAVLAEARELMPHKGTEKRQLSNPELASFPQSLPILVSPAPWLSIELHKAVYESRATKPIKKKKRPKNAAKPIENKVHLKPQQLIILHAGLRHSNHARIGNHEPVPAIMRNHRGSGSS